MTRLTITFIGQKDTVEGYQWVRDNCPDSHDFKGIRHYGDNLYDVSVAFHQKCDAMLWKLKYGGAV